MGGRLVASLYDVTNYAKPMARDEQYLSRTKQTNKHKRQDFLGNNQSTTKRFTTETRWRGTMDGILTIILEPGVVNNDLIRFPQKDERVYVRNRTSGNAI